MGRMAVMLRGHGLRRSGPAGGAIPLAPYHRIVRACVAAPDGSLLVTTEPPLARSGRRLVPITPADLIPLPHEATIAHLPGRRPWVTGRDGHPRRLDDGRQAVAAILPVGYLRTLLPASEPDGRRPRLPLFGYTAVVQQGADLMVAALRTDEFGWWEPRRFGGTDLPAAVAAARAALPGNRLVDHLATCALDNRCYTAQNTFHRRYEGALPASPACNADCLGCISLQPDGVPTPQPRMRFAPTADELADLARFHLSGTDGRIVSFGQGCEGEPLTRGEALVRATARIRREHPDATIHINTNGSRPGTLRRLVDAGLNSVRISAISFTDAIFRAYYRPLDYTLDHVIACGRVVASSGGQVCLNLLTFPGITDLPEEIDHTIAACRDMGVHQIQWRSLNVDHDWLMDVVPPVGEGLGMAAVLGRIVTDLPEVANGNFTRPVVAATG